MFVNTSYGQEGDTTTISSSNFSNDGNAGCVSLNVFGTDINFGRLSVILDYNDGRTEERYLKTVDTYGRWFTEHVLFGSSLRQFHVVATRGDDTGGLIAIDDILILDDTKCIGKCLWMLLQPQNL